MDVHDPVLPTVVTHNYDPAAPFLSNLCDLSDTEAEGVLDRIRALGHRRIKANYLRRRRETEAWLIGERRKLIGGTPLDRPVYFFLGDFADGLDASRSASLVMPLDAFAAEMLTFTYPDSMTSLALGRSEQARPYHGQVFTLAEIRMVVAAQGMPRRKSTLAGESVSDGLIELQVWDDRPIRRVLNAIGQAPDARARDAGPFSRASHPAPC